MWELNQFSIQQPSSLKRKKAAGMGTQQSLGGMYRKSCESSMTEYDLLPR